MIRFLPYSIVSRVVALILLAAALAKIQGLAITPIEGVGFFSRTEIQVGLIELEIVLAFCLLLGKHPIAAWMASVLAFLFFSMVSLYLAWVGKSSCGCFGKFSVSPWYSLGLDLTVLFALLIGRPNLTPLAEHPRLELGRAAAIIGKSLMGVILMLGSFAVVAYFLFGSPDGALAYLRGERISIQPTLVNIGQGEAGEIRQIKIKVVNWSAQPIRVIGGSSDCSCNATGGLPLTIPPNDSRPIELQMAFSKSPGIFTRKVWLLADDNGQRKIGFRLTGQVIETPSRSDSNGNGS